MAKSIREQAGTSRLKVGHFIVEFATPGIGQLLDAAGCDYALIDMEHSGFGYETLKSVLRYLQAGDVPPIVRVPSQAYHHIARAMDMGARGLMLPMVGNAGQAEHIVNCMKYPPRGGRGVALGIAHDRYAPGAVLPKLRAANAETVLFAQIETDEGVRNADSIAAVDGVDCLWVGHFDLSASLGIPGKFEHPRFLDAVDTVAAACAKHGKSLGRLVPDAATGIDYHARGFDFICYSGDVWVYLDAVRAGVAAVRDGARRPSRRKSANKSPKGSSTSASRKSRSKAVS